MSTTTAPASVRPSLGRIMRSTAIVMGFSLAAKVISLGQTVIIAQRFGVSADYDTFVAANTIPEQIFNLIAGGALAYAFIPIFGGLLATDQREKAWRLASNVLNSVFLVALLLSAIVFVAAPALISGVVAPGFSAASQAQTVQLTRVLLLSLLIFSISGLSVGILQSHQHFLLPAMAPMLYDIGILAGVIFLVPPFGVYGLALGAVLGAAAHLLIQVPGLIIFRMKWQPIIDWRDPDLRQVLRLMIPRAIGLFLFNVNMLVAVNLASQISEGATSAFNWGWRLMQLPESLLGTAMGIVIFPTLAALSAAGDQNGKRNAMSGALRFILFSAIPAAVLLIVVGRYALRILEGGALDTAGADLIYSVLIFFAPGVIIHSSVEIVARSFYADKDTITPLYVAMVSAVINVVLAYVLSRPNVLGVPGLSLANSIAVGTELIILLVILRRRWHGINEPALANTGLKTVISAAVMGIVVLASNLVFYRLSGSKLLEALHVIVLSGIGFVTFAVVAYLLRMDEILQLPRMLRNRRNKAA